MSAAGTEALGAEFVTRYGREAAVVCAAPGRVNLIGEYTDLNEGFVLPIAIPQVTHTLAAPRPDRVLRVASLDRRDDPAISIDLDRPEAPVAGWAAYPAAVARALDDAGHRVAGADVLVSSEVPTGAGLSSSAALECAVALALCALSGVELAPMAIAEIAQRAENRYVGVPCGIMDQAASMCAIADHALLLDTRTLAIRQLPFDVHGAGLGLLVVDTRVKHALGDSAYGDRRTACARAAAALGVGALRDVEVGEVAAALEEIAAKAGEEVMRRARHVLSEQARVLQTAELLDAGQIAEIGQVLIAGHASLRDDFEVSCAELDLVVKAAVASGALGARMTGAGFGGSAIVLAAATRLSEIAQEIAARFSAAGYGAPLCFSASASAGARRER
ncbi:MAG: galactokinase [Actinomycetota bacterium]|nr:galactokinase [Actinomycetota bacterium]